MVIRMRSVDFVGHHGHASSSAGAHFAVRLFDSRPFFNHDDSHSDDRTGAEQYKTLSMSASTAHNKQRERQGDGPDEASWSRVSGINSAGIV